VFTGNGVTATNVANVVTVNVPGTTDTFLALGFISGNLAPNRANSSVQAGILDGNLTLNPPVNMSTAQSFTLILTQDGAGNRLLTPNASLKFAGNYKTLSTAGFSVDMINMFYDGTTYYCTLTTGYA
jgi:hypothetical protein